MVGKGGGVLRKPMSYRLGWQVQKATLSCLVSVLVNESNISIRSDTHLEAAHCAILYIHMFLHSA